MSFVVFADGTANLPQEWLDGIRLIPMEYSVDGVSRTYSGDVDHFDAHAYYEGLKRGRRVQTSLLNVDAFLTAFAPVLEEGRDVIYVSMSSSISGTCHAARTAARELMERYPGRLVHVVDSMGCGFGGGMLAIRAAELCRAGEETARAAAFLDGEAPHMCQYFTVDDLNHLKRTGRVSGATARIATVLGIKPILYGDAEGRITACAKVRGRGRSIRAIAEKFREKRDGGEEPLVFISHGDCPEDAGTLAGLVREICPGSRVTICQHEPVSGAHVGPGMLALFFRGRER